jgi:hypothetical protein
MGLLSFLSRRAALLAVTSAEAEVLRTRLATMSAVLDDVSAELVRMRRREEAQSARFEQLTGRIDFLARQVRELAAASKECDVGKALRVARDVEKFFVEDRAGPRT